MQTIGYWCDYCRTKYVRHKCKQSLPCRHLKKEAIFVYAKAFRQNGEIVEMAIPGRSKVVELWIEPKPKTRKILYVGEEARMLHGHHVVVASEVMDVYDWLKVQSGPVIRAFLGRWESREFPPTWRYVEVPRIGGPRLFPTTAPDLP